MGRITRRQVITAIGAGVAIPFVLRAQEQRAIRIGGMLPLSGPASIEGHQIILGLQFAVDEANAKGGVLGRQIELVMEDDESNSTKGVTIVRKFIERDHVPFIVGTYASAVALAATRVAREYKVPMMSGGSTGAIVTDDNPKGDPWFFRCWPDSNLQGEGTAQDIIRVLKKTKIAIIRDNTNYGTTLAEQVTRVAAAEGASIVSTDTYNAGEQDFSSMLTRLRTLKPDAVYLAGWAGDGANIVRQAAEVGLKAQFVGSGSMLSDDFIKIAGAASEGFAVATPFESSTPNEVGRAWSARFRAKYSAEPNTFNALGYDSTNIAIEAMRRSGAPEGVAIQKMLVSGMKDFSIVEGPVGTTAAFDEKGSVNFRNFMAIVRNGKRSLSNNT